MTLISNVTLNNFFPLIICDMLKKLSERQFMCSSFLYCYLVSIYYVCLWVIFDCLLKSTNIINIVPFITCGSNSVYECIRSVHPPKTFLCALFACERFNNAQSFMLKYWTNVFSLSFCYVHIFSYICIVLPIKCTGAATRAFMF